MKRVIALLTCLCLLPFLTGAAFPFSFWKSAAGSSSPAFVTENTRVFDTAGGTTVVFSPASNIAAATPVVLMGLGYGNITVTGVSDGSNTWVVRQTVTDSNAAHCFIVTSANASGLTTSSSITVTYSGSGGDRYVSLCTISGITTGYQTGNTSIPFGSSVALTQTTTAASVNFGCLAGDSNSALYTWSGTWTVIGSSVTYQGAAHRGYFLYFNAASSGSQGPGGSWSNGIQQCNAIAALQ